MERPLKDLVGLKTQTIHIELQAGKGSEGNDQENSWRVDQSGHTKWKTVEREEE